ncbi:MAG: 3'(2'),5'-bisphosphate nucleotidase CysQ, partial [Saprospiraceae bacterium]
MVGSDEIKKILDLAIEASLKAGESILQVYNASSIKVDFKSDNSPLTQADLVSHQAIVHYLNSTPYPILSEEGKLMSGNQRKELNTIWIVDPLDGTKEFVNRNGEFTVNIALVEDHLPILGVVYAPVTKEIYFAAKGIGSYKTIANTNGRIEDIRNTANQLPLIKGNEVFKVVASRSHLTPETEDYINQLRNDHPQIEITSRGSSLKLCMVAEGSADCYPRFAPTMEWDTAAGHAICRYSGAQVIDYLT